MPVPFKMRRDTRSPLQGEAPPATIIFTTNRVGQAFRAKRGSLYVKNWNLDIPCWILKTIFSPPSAFVVQYFSLFRVFSVFRSLKSSLFSAIFAPLRRPFWIRRSMFDVIAHLLPRSLPRSAWTRLKHPRSHDIQEMVSLYFPRGKEFCMRDSSNAIHKAMKTSGMK